MEYGVIIVEAVKAYAHQEVLWERHSGRLDVWTAAAAEQLFFC